jgi:PEGA domain
MRNVRIFGCVMLVGCLLGGHAGSARAESPDSDDLHGVANEKARQTFKEGIEAFDRRDFEAARVAFLQTFALKPGAPVVRRNLGLAEIYSGHYLEGARRLARVLHMTGEGTAQDRARMLESLKKAEAHLERLTLEVNVEGAEIVVDGVDLGTSPLPFVWYLAPGSYDVRIEKADLVPFFQRRIAQAGNVQHLRVSLKPKPASESPPPARDVAPAPPAPQVSSGPRGWVLVTGGALTAAGIAAGVSLSVLASSNADEADQLRNTLGGLACPDTDVAVCAQLDDAIDDYNRQVTWARVSFIAAGVTGVSTLLYGLLAGPSEPRHEGEAASATRFPWAAASFGVELTPGGTELLMSGTF